VDKKESTDYEQEKTARGGCATHHSRRDGRRTLRAHGEGRRGTGRSPTAQLVLVERDFKLPGMVGMMFIAAKSSPDFLAFLQKAARKLFRHEQPVRGSTVFHAAKPVLLCVKELLFIRIRRLACHDCDGRHAPHNTSPSGTKQGRGVWGTVGGTLNPGGKSLERPVCWFCYINKK
jgi:hypothetical protein